MPAQENVRVNLRRFDLIRPRVVVFTLLLARLRLRLPALPPASRRQPPVVLLLVGFLEFGGGAQLDRLLPGLQEAAPAEGPCGGLVEGLRAAAAGALETVLRALLVVVRVQAVWCCFSLSKGCGGC